ncbi:MAG: helix-turn-helix domain-containing protein [Candidatus Parvarchaeota archaeon]
MYLLLDRWNSRGIEGLIPMPRGRFMAKLTDRQMNQVREDISNGSWITNEVRKHISSRFNADYSLRQVSRILKKFNMHHAKPFPRTATEQKMLKRS